MSSRSLRGQEGWVRRASLFTFAVAFFFTGPACVKAQLDVRAAFELASTDTETLTPDSVIRACSIVIDDKANHPRATVEKAYESRGRALTQQEKFDSARKDLEELVKLRPEDAKCRSLLALTLLHLGLKDEATLEATKATNLAPDSALGFAVLGLVASATGDIAGGFRHSSKAISLNAKEPMGYYVRANLYYVQLDAHRCLHDVTRLVELQPLAGSLESAKLYEIRGMCLLWLQRPKEAIPNFLLARRLNSASLETIWGLEKAYSDLGRWHIALELAREALRIAPKDPRNLCLLAEANARLGKSKAAKSGVEEALALAPGDLTVLYQAGEVYLALGEYLPALGCWDMVLDKDASHRLALRSKAILLAAIPDDSVRNGPKALELARKDQADSGLPYWDLWRSNMAVAIAQAECGNYEEAVRLARRSLELMGPDSGYRVECEQHLRQFEKRQPFRLGGAPLVQKK